MSKAKRKGQRLAIGLGALQVFIGIGGVAGGVGLVSEPSGANLGLAVELLSDSPFSDFLIPGIVLLAINGVGSLSGCMVSFFKYRYAGGIATALGAFLILWIVAQVWWLGLHWLHPLYFGFGLAEVVLGLLLRRALHTV